MSKRKTLYKRVFITTLVFAVAIAAFSMFFMTPRVTISFHTNVPEVAIPAIQVNQDEVFGEENYDYVVRNELSKTGYIFDDWYAGNMPLSPVTIFSDDTIIEARWIAKQYDLTFDLDGGVYTATPSFLDEYEDTIAFDETIALPTDENFEKPVQGADYLVLDKWEVQTNKTDKRYSIDAGEDFVMNSLENLINLAELEPSESVEDVTTFIYGEVQLKAIWKQQEVTLTFVGQDGTTSQETVIVKGGTMDVANIPTFTSSTHDLVGWYYDQAFTQAVDFNTDTFSADTTLYSDWQPKGFEVLFNAMDAQSAETANTFTQTVLFGEYAFSPDPPQRTNYNFIEWRVLEAGVNINDLNQDNDTDDMGNLAYVFTNANSHVFDFENESITSDITVYAVWELQYEYQNDLIGKIYLRYTTDDANKTITLTGFSSAVYASELMVLPEYIIEGAGNEPYYITSIAAGAFADMTALKTIVLSEYITTIEDGAFGDSAGILDTLEKFEVWSTNPVYADLNGVLYNKDYTTLIKYPAAKADTDFVVGIEGRSVDTIGNYAFAGTTNLTNLTVNVTTIGNGAFAGAESLTTLTLTDKVQSIGQNAFAGTTNLTTIIVEEGNTNFAADDWGVYTSGFETLLYYKLSKGSSSVLINPNTTTIGRSAFAYNTVLRTVNLNNVQVIESYAFANTGITALNMNDNLLQINNNAFYGSIGITALTLPASLTQISSFTQTGDAIDDNIFASLTGLITITVTTGSVADEYVTQLQGQGALTTVTVIRV